MKIFLKTIIISLLLANSLFAMRKHPGQEMAAESSKKLKTEAASESTQQEADDVLPIQDLPQELQAMILTQIQGNNLQTAAANIRNAMSVDTNFRQFFNDVVVNGRIIQSLAKRYTNNNPIIAALAFHTRGGMQWLLDYAKNPATIQNFRRSFSEALYFAVNTNNPPALQFLITHFPHFVQANINHLYTYRIPAEAGRYEYSSAPLTLLMLAAQKGYNRIIQQLLDAGARVNARNTERSTALMYAAYYGNADTVQLLYNRGANINLRNEFNHTALFLAGLEGHENIVRMLLIAGTQLDEDAEHLLTHAAAEGFIGILRLLLARNVEINDPDPDTPLMAAAEMGQLQAVRILLHAGADVNLHDVGDGENTALMFAAHAPFHNRMNEYIEIVRLLLQAGANIDDENEEGITALMFAVAEGNVEIIKILLDAGANLDIRNNDGDTALAIALRSENQNKEIIIKLLEEAIKKQRERPVKWIRSEIEKKK